MPSAKEYMERARTLIKAGRYEEAREILVRLAPKVPTAQKWLDQLDARLEADDDVPRPTESKPTASKSSGGRRWLLLLVSVIVIVVVGVAAILLSQNNDDDDPDDMPTAVAVQTENQPTVAAAVTAVPTDTAEMTSSDSPTAEIMTPAFDSAQVDFNSIEIGSRFGPLDQTVSDSSGAISVNIPADWFAATVSNAGADNTPVLGITNAQRLIESDGGLLQPGEFGVAVTVLPGAAGDLTTLVPPTISGAQSITALFLPTVAFMNSPMPGVDALTVLVEIDNETVVGFSAQTLQGEMSEDYIATVLAMTQGVTVDLDVIDTLTVDDGMGGGLPSDDLGGDLDVTIESDFGPLTQTVTDPSGQFSLDLPENWLSTSVDGQLVIANTQRLLDDLEAPPDFGDVRISPSTIFGVDDVLPLLESSFSVGSTLVAPQYVTRTDVRMAVIVADMFVFEQIGVAVEIDAGDWVLLRVTTDLNEAESAFLPTVLAIAETARIPDMG